MVEQAWISFDLVVKDDVLKFKLINGKPRTANNDRSSQVGLLNVKRRLSLLYPNAHDLRITEDDDTFVVNLTLQLNKVTLPDAYEHVSLPAR